MEWPISMDFGNGVFIDAIITISSENGEVIMEFSDEMRETLLIDKLSSFETIKFSKDNHLHAILKGKASTRSFKFKQEDALHNVVNFIANFFTLKPANHKNRKLLIISKNAQRKKSPPAQNDVGNCELPPSNEPEGLSTGLIRESISELDFKLITQSSFPKIFAHGYFESVKPYEIEVQPAFSFDLWLRLLLAPSLEDDYSKICSQWKPLLHEIWERDRKLRTFVSALEGSISNSSLSQQRQKLLFDSLMTLYVSQMESAAFSQSIVDLGIFLIDSLIAADSEQDSFCCQNGDVISFQSAASQIYSLLSAISEIKPIRPYTRILSLLEDSSPTTQSLLLLYKSDNFSVVDEYVSSFLLKGRSFEDKQLMLTSMLGSSDREAFVSAFLASGLILFHPRLSEVPPSNPAQFFSLFVELLSSTSLRLLLFNASQLMDFTKDSTS